MEVRAIAVFMKVSQIAVPQIFITNKRALQKFQHYSVTTGWLLWRTRLGLFGIDLWLNFGLAEMDGRE